MKKQLNKNIILKLLRKHKEELKGKFPMRSIAIFGSYARAEQSEGSDIDLLVDFSEPVGMEVVDLAMELEEILGNKVDLVTYNAIKNRLFQMIEPDLIYA